MSTSPLSNSQPDGSATRSRRQVPPLVPGIPFFGNAFQVARNPAEFFVQAYRDYGPAYRFRIPGHEFIVLAGPEANQFFAQMDGRLFSSRRTYHQLVREVGTENYLPAMDGEPHHYMRKAYRPAFSREALSPYLPSMVELVREAAHSWQPGQRLPALETLTRLSVEALSRAMGNCPVGDHHADVAAYAYTFTGSGVAFRPRILLYLPPYLPAKWRFEAFLKTIVDTHRAHAPNESRRPDMVDTLLALTDPNGSPLDEKQVVAAAHLPYLNGVIYAGRACTYLLYALLKHPSILERVIGEVDAAFAGGPPDAQRLRRMTLLRGALMEAFRLYPIAVAVPRYVIQPFEFAGYQVPAGRLVFVATTATHFLPKLFPNPYTFDPERWSGPRDGERTPGAFAALGLGTHSCLGAGLVEMVLMTIMATLLHTVRLQLDPPSYTLKTVVDPVPGPDRRFMLKVDQQREALAASAQPLPIADEELSMMLPDLARERLAEVVAQLERIGYPPGAIIIRQGDLADRFYILARGEVEVLDERGEAGPRLLARLSSGEYFGEIGLLHGIKRTATVRAVGEVEVLAMDRDTFTEVVAESDLTSAEIARVVRRRLMSASIAAALPALDASRADALLEQFEWLEYQPGAVIIRQGDPADSFYVVARGRCEVLVRQPDGQEASVNWVERGEYFGEIGLLQNRPRTATVRADPAGGASVIALDREQFGNIIAESEQTGRDMALLMYQRLLGLATAEVSASFSL